MAEPGDPSNADDHDDLIGFASPASLQGRTREPAAEPTPEPESVAQPDPDLPRMAEPAPEPPGPDSEPDLFETQTVWTSAPARPAPAAVIATPDLVSDATEANSPPTPAVEAGSAFALSPEPPRHRRRRDPVVDLPGGGMGLYAVYALILFAVPTLGVSAALGLFAVTGRAGPDDALSSSHFVYQQRTLWAAAVTAVAGLILLAAPFALGVPILFLLALWLVLRGASGVWTLKSGRAIADPRGWWI